MIPTFNIYLSNMLKVGQLNMAMFPSSMNSSLASTSSLGTIGTISRYLLHVLILGCYSLFRNSGSSSVGTLNTALVEEARKPAVDRASKREALDR